MAEPESDRFRVGDAEEGTQAADDELAGRVLGSREQSGETKGGLGACASPV
jgi:hypothetical protein